MWVTAHTTTALRQAVRQSTLSMSVHPDGAAGWVFTRESGLGTRFCTQPTNMIQPLSGMFMVYSYIKPDIDPSTYYHGDVRRRIFEPGHGGSGGAGPHTSSHQNERIKGDPPPTRQSHPAPRLGSNGMHTIRFSFCCSGPWHDCDQQFCRVQSRHQVFWCLVSGVVVWWCLVPTPEQAPGPRACSQRQAARFRVQDLGFRA